MPGVLNIVLISTVNAGFTPPTQSSLSLLAGAASFSSTTLAECVSTPWASLHLSTEEHKLHLVLSEVQLSVFSAITWSDSDYLPVCSSYSVFFFLVLFEAGVSADVRYSHHPAAAAKTADAGTSSLQHCDCQSRLSQTRREGSASCSDCKPFLQPYRNSSKGVLGGRHCYFCIAFSSVERWSRASAGFCNHQSHSHRVISEVQGDNEAVSVIWQALAVS